MQLQGLARGATTGLVIAYESSCVPFAHGSNCVAKVGGFGGKGLGLLYLTGSMET